jgi:hypothetical protein
MQGEGGNQSSRHRSISGNNTNHAEDSTSLSRQLYTDKSLDQLQSSEMNQRGQIRNLDNQAESYFLALDTVFHPPQSFSNQVGSETHS